MDELVKRLSPAGQAVEVGGPSPSVPDLRRRITELGYVFLKFTTTNGGTDVGVRLEQDRLDLGRADFTAGTGTVHLEGTLTLNFVKVSCVADIDLATLSGKGHLVALAPAPAEPSTPAPAA